MFIRLCLFITQTNVEAFVFPLKTIGTLCILHVSNLQSQDWIDFLITLIFQNVQATIFVRTMHIIIFCSINVIGPFFSIYEESITILHIFIFQYYCWVNQLSNDYYYSPIRSLIWKLWIFEKTVFTQFVHFFS